eukprot:Protomagalhaensia_wolfi_Nauph_80__6050@NODE_841_length_1954_cov_90_901828_g633_i0_p2_GENE_NODE_841_length_1954_cov_90_901828_g633_i0NODE_841_length_1954_cov_90_901828_g633_i0_p2_ORF_typecomplete_len130_score15_25Fip1/PF05182_13/3_3e03Fip1/PF05182_13/0_004_NODE_841_length_1954_cov_90_901828_g633_i0190579
MERPELVVSLGRQVLLFKDSACGDLQTFNQWQSKDPGNMAAENTLMPPPSSLTSQQQQQQSNVVLAFEHTRPWSRRVQRGTQGGPTAEPQCSDYFNYDLTPEKFRAIIVEEIERRQLQQRVRKIEVDDE